MTKMLASEVCAEVAYKGIVDLFLDHFNYSLQKPFSLKSRKKISEELGLM